LTSQFSEEPILVKGSEFKIGRDNNNDYKID